MGPDTVSFARMANKPEQVQVGSGQIEKDRLQPTDQDFQLEELRQEPEVIGNGGSCRRLSEDRASEVCFILVH